METRIGSQPGADVRDHLGEERTSLALDLPLKVLVWESEDGPVCLSYNSPEFLQERHGLDTRPFGVLANLVAAAAEYRK
jgi:uncharacterized protein (DUF302 family)